MEKKICHVTSVHEFDDIRIFNKECRTLFQNGWNVFVLASAKDRAEFLKEGVHIVTIPARRTWRLLRMTRTVYEFYIEAIRLDCSIYHIHDPELLPMALLLHHKGKKIIYDVHEDVPRQIVNKKWLALPVRSIVAAIFERFENWAVRHFDYIVTATEHITKRFIDLNQNTITVCNYPLLEEFLDNLIITEQDTRTFVYIGAINEVRGIMQMIDATAEVNARLELAGEFETAQASENAKNRDGWKKVSFRGSLNRIQINQLLRGSVAGLVLLHPTPAYVHALPVKLFEYMAAGIPVIASDFPLLQGIVNVTGCGFCVNPLNVEDICSAMQWIIENPAKAKEMGLKGRIAVLEQFNWTSEGKKLTAIYEGLLMGNNI